MTSSFSLNSLKVHSLDVYLNITRVGTLTWFAPDRTIFVVDENYVADNLRPTLSLSLKSASGRIIAQPWESNLKLPPFFSNLLPEGKLREYLALRNNVHKDREFFLLHSLKDDLPGAVVLKSLEEESLSAERSQPLIETGTKPLKFSLGGVQLKFSALLESSGGLTVPANGAGGNWIVKLASQDYPYNIQNEFFMLELAQRVGINVPSLFITETSAVDGLPELARNFDTTCLAIKRFDRGDSGQRIHIEDFAQIYSIYAHDKYKGVSYTNMASLIWVETGEEGLIEFIRRLVFNIAIGNNDMHLKNWSLIYPDRRTAQLAPAYDFVSTVAWLDDDDLALKLAGIREMHRVGLQTFAELADRAQLPKRLVVDTVNDTVARFKGVWTAAAKELPVPTKMAKKIKRHVESLPLLKKVRRQ